MTVRFHRTRNFRECTTKLSPIDVSANAAGSECPGWPPARLGACAMATEPAAERTLESVQDWEAGLNPARRSPLRRRGYHGLTGVTAAQRAALLALGAVDHQGLASETTAGVPPRSANP